ncbi:GPI-GlcNAc transferase complex PIG-H component conserved domain, partial [Trinorchestia longiramus]
MKSRTALFSNVSGKSLIYQQLRQKETDLGTATEVCICAAEAVCLRRWLLLTSVVSLVLVSLLQLHQRLQPPLLLLIIVLQFCVLLYRCHHKVVSERLLLVAGLGAQVTTRFSSGRRHVSFVPWAALVDVIIAETISM